MMQPWISFDHVSIMRGERLVLKDISFTVKKGEVVTLRGPNGSGKSTTLHLCANLLTPSSGTITFAPHVPIAYLGHNNGLSRDLSVVQNLRFFSKLLQQNHREAMIESVLENLGLATLKSLPLGYLSCGQQRRAALARLLLHPGKLWLLDEPVSNLDEQTTAWFVDQLMTHQENGGAVLMACHTPLPIPHSREVYLGLA